MTNHQERPEADFNLFISTLALEAKVALGLDVSNSEFTAESHQLNLPKAHYMISILRVIRDKTEGNLSSDESQLLRKLLDQLEIDFELIEQQSPPDLD